MRVLFIGNRTSLDFRPARRRLAADAERGECELSEEADIASALATIARRRLDENSPPDLLLLTQSRPGELTDSGVNRLRRRAPLAMIVVILGSWCEGEGRSGDPLPGVVRVPWHRFGPEWQRHLACWRRGRCSAWELPSTATDEERLLWASEFRTAGANEERDAVHVLLARSRDSSDDWLAAMCRALGWAVTDHVGQGIDTADGPCVGIWQSDALDANALSKLTNFARRLLPTPVIAIVGFPRPEDDARIRAAGALSLLAKPLAIDDLAAEVEWLLSERGVVAQKS